MSILSKYQWGIVILVVLAGLAYCSRGSSAYHHTMTLPKEESQWESYAATLTVEQRLDLHKEIMERSGHNPSMTLRFAFSSQPEQTYKAIIKRLKSGDRSYYYFSVLSNIEGRNGFDICAQADRKIIQKYIFENFPYRNPRSDDPGFYDC